MNGNTQGGNHESCQLYPQCLAFARLWAGRSEFEPHDFSTRSVLVVDDEQMIRDMTKQVIFNRIGCRTETAESGNAALERLEQEPFDVVITDMVMPGLHGLELISSVRNRWPNVDIIVLTGFVEQFPYVEVIQAGANDFITKPQRPQELEAKLLRLFRERALREQLLLTESRYRSLFERSMESYALLEPDSFIIMDVNSAFCDMAGLDRVGVVGQDLFSYVSDADEERVKAAFGIFERGGQGTLGDVAVKRSDGEELSVDLSVTFVSAPTEPIVFLSFRDVTERRREEQQLKRVAQTDSLTGLLNKSVLNARLQAAIIRAGQTSQPLSLMFIDLDNFKQCNDIHGHQVGDLLLQEVGKLVQGSLRESDEAFRYGGDEMAIILPGTEKESAVIVADRLRHRFDNENRYGTSMSIGIAELEAEMDGPALIKAADTALYEAKRSGRNRVVLH